MRPDRDFLHEWHVAINRFTDGKAGSPDWPHFMYEAKAIADEVPRLKLLFERERTGKLSKVHQQCSHSEPEPIQENHLTCALGVKCSECPYLKALEVERLKPEQVDESKAWTCITHILVQAKGDISGEGYVVTVDDRMFWDRVHASLSQEPADKASEGHTK